MQYSSTRVSICLTTKRAGTGKTSFTLFWFWAVRAVITDNPFNPKSSKVFKSLCIPAPTEGSAPAMVKTNFFMSNLKCAREKTENPIEKTAQQTTSDARQL